MLSQFVCWLYSHGLGDSQNAWYALQFGTVCALALGVAWLDARKEGYGIDIGTVVSLYILFAVAILVCWLPNMARYHMDPDEEQWIAQANNFVADPVFWLKYFLAINNTRELTILPMAMGSALCGGSLGYEGARIITILLWAAFCVLIYGIMTIACGRQCGIWTSFSIAVLLCFFSSVSYVAYNSELPVIVLCAAATYCFVSGYRAASPRRYVAAGLCAALIPFAKDQGIPLAAALQFVFVAFCLVQGRKAAVGWIVGGNVIGFLAFLALFATTGSLGELVDLKRTAAEYAQIGFASQEPRWLRGALYLRAMLVRDELRPLFLGALVITPFLLWSYVRCRANWSPLQSLLLWCGVAVMGAAFFAVWYPGNGFHHYALLLVFPASLLLGSALHLVFREGHRNSWVVAFLFLLVCLLGLYRKDGSEGVRDLARNCADDHLSAMSEKMLQLTVPGDRLMVWGWWPAFFVETGLLQGSRWMYPFFAVSAYGSSASNVRRYMDDLRQLRPKVIVEWVGEDAIHFKDPEVFGLRAVPEINEYVMANYDLVAQEGNQKLFLRKQ